MASTANVLLCAAVAALVWTVVGLAVARYVAPARSLASAIAPALGWAVHSALALPFHMLFGLSRVAVAAFIGGALAASAFVLMRHRNAPDTSGDDAPGVPVWAWIGAALVALGPALAILPKVVDEGVILAVPIFDHAKVAMIDEMARLGVPPGNPFFGETGDASRLAYYYLWHFGAAELAVLLGVSGWEADAAGTWFAAFASLMLMIGLAVWLSRQRLAAVLVLLVSMTGSLRLLLKQIPGIDWVIRDGNGFAGWLFQSAWVPQHIASATCVVLAVVLVLQLARSWSVPVLAALVLVVVAAFESSTWVGGVTFAIAAGWIGVALISDMAPRERLTFVTWCGLAAIAAAMLAAPFLYDQAIANALRGGGLPVTLWPYDVLGQAFPDSIRRFLDLPAFWIVLLTIELPAVYVTGIVALVQFGRAAELDAARQQFVRTFAGLIGASLAVVWLFVSTVADNNDLGWRAVLPAAMALTVFAAAGLARWIATRARLAIAGAFAAIALALPGGIEMIRHNATGYASPSARAFAATPSMWAAVRRHAKLGERVGNNPLFLADMTLWPVNISWALMSNRRSCYAGNDLVMPFAPMPRIRQASLNALAVRVFSGEGDIDDVRQLASRYDCRVVVVTALDGAWQRDPFAASPQYRLVETSSAQGWRIYAVSNVALADR